MRFRTFMLTGVFALLLLFGLVVALDAAAAVASARVAQSPTAVSDIPAAVTVDHGDAISKALAYLGTKQLDNGGLECWTPGTADDFTTIKTVIALAASGRPASFLTSLSGNTPLDYLAAQAITYTHDATGTLFPGRAGMLAVAAVAGNEDPYSFGGMDIIGELNATYHPATGAYSTTAKAGFSSGAADTINQVWAVLGLAAVQEVVPVSATDFLISLQEADGGWGYGFGGDVDVTSLVIQALLASGNVEPTHVEAQEGLTFLRGAQAASGGWESWGSLSADSTAAAIQAIVAAGYTPATESWAAGGGRTPHDDLGDLQGTDGSFSGNALGTAHAIPGLAEAPLPVFGRTQRAGRALTWMNERQNIDGSWASFGGNEGATCDAVLAYATAGFDPDTVAAPGSLTSAMDYLESVALSFANQGPDSAGKLALAVETAGADAYHFGGVDIIHVLTSTHYSSTLGAFGVPTNTYHQAFAILGLAAAGEAIPVSATQTLADLQQLDGGWKYDLSPSPWNTTSPDHTGLALQALTAGAVLPTADGIVNAVAFLNAWQDDQGGWGNTNSTAYAMQGLLAAGEDLTADWSQDGHTPYDALATYQKPDGPFVWAWLWPPDNGMATWQAVPALLGVHYPHSPGVLRVFSGVYRAFDPDRMLAAPPRLAWGNSVDVTIPFGSDLNSDGSVALDWRGVGETEWVTGTIVYRANGYYTSTLPVTVPVPCEVQATFTDVDGVQYGTTMTDTIVLTAAFYAVYLPIVSR